MLLEERIIFQNGKYKILGSFKILHFSKPVRLVAYSNNEIKYSYEGYC